jgi:hypothetical protein
LAADYITNGAGFVNLFAGWANVCGCRITVPNRNGFRVPVAICQSVIGSPAYQSKKYLISLTKMVGAQGIEPWTSPV